MVAGSNPAVPTFCEILTRSRGQQTNERLVDDALETVYLLQGIIGFMGLIAIFFFGGFVILDFLFSRFSREP